MASPSTDTDKLAYFQAITGLDDPSLSAQILAAHNWDLNLAISAFTDHSSATTSNSSPNPSPNPQTLGAVANPPTLAWTLITLPFTVAAGAANLSLWIAGGILSRSLSLLGLTRIPRQTNPLLPLSPSAAEAIEFIDDFNRQFGGGGNPILVRFSGEGFMEALQRSQREYRLMFVYLHSPDHPDVPGFCAGTMCDAAVAGFVNENFVAWGGSIRRSEGFKMSNSLKASRFPFCAVVMASTNQRIALLQQIEGPRTPEEMLSVLQRVVEEYSPSLVAARIEAEERLNNQRLREEQDAAYRAALEADQAREHERREQEEKLKREAEEAERKVREEEEARERAAREAAEKEAALARRRQEKAMSLGVEPEKGPNVTTVLVRFPSGERKERRFGSSATISTLYDYVDSLDCLKAEKYTLVSNFPRVSYGPDKHLLTLKEAGLHPQASLFVELDS